MMGFIYSTFIYPLVYIFPAYAANGAPVLFGGEAPLDFRRKVSGKRIFGDNKTIRGTLSSMLAGIAVGIIEYPFLPFMVGVAILSSIGANIGDLLGSFIKRRVGTKPGTSIPLLDQYGFLILALVFAYPLGYGPSLYGLIFLLVLTGAAHILTNIGAHKLKLKSVPW
jgi:CDP-2,3-bis-(O-geranylgeranyl)-sn-glycerol synthase